MQGGRERPSQGSKFMGKARGYDLGSMMGPLRKMGRRICWALYRRPDSCGGWGLSELAPREPWAGGREGAVVRVRRSLAVRGQGRLRSAACSCESAPPWQVCPTESAHFLVTVTCAWPAQQQLPVGLRSPRVRTRDGGGAASVQEPPQGYLTRGYLIRGWAL